MITGIPTPFPSQSQGVIKLKIFNLAAIAGTICFKDQLQLALFRARASDSWNYLQKKNLVNERTQNVQPRVTILPIPETPNSKEAKRYFKANIDTTRVRLCFQVRVLIFHVLYETTL